MAVRLVFSLHRPIRLLQFSPVFELTMRACLNSFAGPMITASVAIDEYLEQVRQRVHVIEREAGYMLSLLATKRGWRPENPATEMIGRGLESIQKLAARIQLKSLVPLLGLSIQAPCANDTQNLSFLERFENLMRQEGVLETAERQLAAFREVLHQRGSMVDSWDWATWQQHTDDLGDLQGFYTAIDSALLGFYCDVYGMKWVEIHEEKRDHWLPVAVVGDAYSIIAGAGVTYIPRAELYRGRLLASLAHEIAHLKVGRLFNPGGLLWPKGWHPLEGGLLAGSIDDLDWNELALLGVQCGPKNGEAIAENYEILARTIFETVSSALGGKTPDKVLVPFWHEQVTEFLCDAVSVHVAGPAALLSYLVTHYPRPPSRIEKMNAALVGSHPPRKIRIAVMAEILSARGFRKMITDIGVQEYFFYADNAPIQEWEAYLDKWQNLVPEIAQLAANLVSWVLPEETRPLTTAHLDQLNPILDGKQESSPETMPQLTPREIVNVAWLKRLREAHVAKSLGKGRYDERISRKLARVDSQPRALGAILRALNEYGRHQWSEIRRRASIHRSQPCKV